MAGFGCVGEQQKHWDLSAGLSVCTLYMGPLGPEVDSPGPGLHFDIRRQMLDWHPSKVLGTNVYQQPVKLWDLRAGLSACKMCPYGAHPHLAVFWVCVFQHFIDAADVPSILQSLKGVVNILVTGRAPPMIASFLAGATPSDLAILVRHGLKRRRRRQYVDEVSARHKKRKLAVLRNNAVEALSFAESYVWSDFRYALTLRTSSGESVSLPLSDDTAAQAELEETEVCQVLYLLDRFGVSDAFYQELSMQFESRLPRAHKVKAVRTELNETVELIRIPGYDGCYRHVENAVCEEISRLLVEFPTALKQGDRIRIKFSGDGAKFSRTTNILILSFSILHPQTRYLSGAEINGEQCVTPTGQMQMPKWCVASWVIQMVTLYQVLTMDQDLLQLTALLLVDVEAMRA
eukprot:Em0002g92a